MKKIIILAYFLMISSMFAQSSHEKFDFNCALCHSCENPTKINPCLKPCPRAEIITVHHSAKEGPDVLVMDNFTGREDNFEAVKFSHRAHAEMSTMSGGCEMCHHYNPPGRVASCKDCHEVSRIRDDLRKPDLKGAYHRQCIKCHSIWKTDVKCGDCHANNEGVKSETPSVANSASEYHPSIEVPTKLVYDTSKEMEGFVTFFHNDHNELFGLTCNDCHKEESCAKCHMEEELLKSRKITVDDKHSVCSNCHDTEDKCESCHKPNVSERFMHATATGFDLTKYHSKLACLNCHKKEKKFSGLNKNCSTCHNNWNSENFNHSITGIVLDEIHIENDCSDCHPDNNYSSPKCESCHDDISYPVKIPGKRIKK